MLGDLLEGAVALVVEEAGLAVAGDGEVFEAVVIVVSDAGSLAPAFGGKSCFCSDISESSVVVVVVKVACGGDGGGLHGGAVDEKDVLPAVVVVVEDGYAGACGLEDVALGVDASVDVSGGKSGFFGYVDEPGCGWVVNGGGVGGLGLEGTSDEEERYEKRDRVRGVCVLFFHADRL